tara:strand:+ start:11155 stop:12063 length:909 start_codon:yes stop_codon:yes gene_type:complete
MENEKFDDRLNLFELFEILWSGKYIILTITFAFGLLTLIYSLILPNIYTSKTLLAPQDSSENISSTLGQFSSIAAIGGINLPAENATMSQEAIKRIKSFSFFSEHFLPNIKLENIMAVKSWDAKNDVIIYNDNDFNTEKNIWIRKVKFPKQVIPSNQEAYEVYKEILKISEDKDTSFVNLSVDHVSPKIAKEWVEIIIKKINSSMQDMDKKNAESSIDFLNEYSKSTNLQPVQDAISNLLEIEMQTLMLTSANDFYVYKVIDYPIVSEEKANPNRIFISITGTLFGLLISLVLVLFRHYGQK